MGKLCHLEESDVGSMWFRWFREGLIGILCRGEESDGGPMS